MPSAGSLLRQLSGKEAWKSRTRRWNSFSGSINNTYNNNGYNYHNNNNPSGSNVYERSWNQMQGGGMNNMYSGGGGYNNNADDGGMMMSRKRVMVVVDETSRSKHAMMWALTHVTNKGDWLTLLHVTCGSGSESSSNPYLATSLGSLCKASKPEVEVEALVIQGPKLATILSQVKKLEVAILVLGQKKPSPIINCLFGISGSDDVVEQCINNAECLAIGVRKQSKGMGGYLISTRYQRNFWLLA